jgi:hypothetical protein
VHVDDQRDGLAARVGAWHVHQILALDAVVLEAELVVVGFERRRRTIRGLRVGICLAWLTRDVLADVARVGRIARRLIAATRQCDEQD